MGILKVKTSLFRFPYASLNLSGQRSGVGAGFAGLGSFSTVFLTGWKVH